MKRYIFYVLLLALLAATPAEMMAQRRAKTTKNRKAKTERTTQGTNGKAVSGNQSFTVGGVSFTMIAVQGGTFTMGATGEQGSDAYDDEKPAHKVTVSSFSIGQTEVTQELWQAVMGGNPSEFKGAKRPVENVSWDDCQEFIRKLNAKTGKSFRLPTEAEWEYAARGGSRSQGYKYSGGNSVGDVAWYDVNSYDKGKSSPDYGTHNVATKRANELGLYDMSGNVWEWCSDWYGSYSSSSQTNPTGPSWGSNRVCRGGSWGRDAWSCRLAYRVRSSPDLRLDNLGLRLAL
ncbi:MAG: formylglycine-generating enzyme family protein [Muribaculaceae bacterium]|nr:formylglycine-generating enzyme family protein [Muribaculaceae bacterium]